MALHKLAERTWLTADRSRTVPEGDPAAAFLLGGEGTEIEMAEAERLGLVQGKAKAEPEAPATKAVDQAEVADKAVDGPRHGRSARGAE